MESARAAQYAFEGVGLNTPASRFVAGAAAGVLLTEALRLEVTHTPEGKWRPWVLLDSESENSTYFPFFLPALVVGGAMATLF